MSETIASGLGRTTGCSECVLGDEDPRAWCDCLSTDEGPCRPGPCVKRAHAYDACPVALGTGVDWADWETWGLRVSTIVSDPDHCYICNHQHNHHGRACPTKISREQADWIRHKRQLEGITITSDGIRVGTLTIAPVKKLTGQQIEDAIVVLVATRYPYEVRDVLDEIAHPDDRAVVVAAALARSVARGKADGRAEQKREIRAKLGL